MKFLINNKPNIQYFWKGLGGHFDSFDQLLNEFIDNSISNFKANNPIQKNILISFEEKQNCIDISVEDTGTGINDISKTFTLGEQVSRETPLNEHGFGMKHALATADPTNSNWVIFTRNEQNVANNNYAKIIAPYDLDNFTGNYIDTNIEKWPGFYNTTGTVIKFCCSKDLFKTIRKGLKGNYGFSKMIDILVEDLGFTYANIIKEGYASITLTEINLDGTRRPINVPCIEPNWEKHFSPGKNQEKVDLGNGEVLLKYEFGSMNDSDHFKYYKKNMSSSGLELRLNGRLISYNIFKDIWGIEKHNSYNYLLIRVDIISENRDRLPVTRTSKNGIRKGDDKLEKLYEWVRSYLSEPSKNHNDIDHEVDLFCELSNQKKIHLTGPKVVETEYRTFNKINERISIDLYIKDNTGVTIYEGKKDISSVKDLYQLKMYWDGLTIDGIKPTRAILIASEHPNSVKTMITYVNLMKDINGDNYNFSCKTWQEEGIRYPN